MSISASSICLLFAFRQLTFYDLFLQGRWGGGGGVATAELSFCLHFCIYIIFKITKNGNKGLVAILMFLYLTKLI